MFTIHIDRLRVHDHEEIQETVPPKFLDIEADPEIQPLADVCFSGSAYLAGDWLIVQGHLSTEIKATCAKCNEACTLSINIPDWRHEEAVSAIRGGIFSYAELIREAILLEVPYYVLCGGSACVKADEIAPYIRASELSEAPSSARGGTKGKKEPASYEQEVRENGHQPFKDFF